MRARANVYDVFTTSEAGGLGTCFFTSYDFVRIEGQWDSSVVELWGHNREYLSLNLSRLPAGERASIQESQQLHSHGEEVIREQMRLNKRFQLRERRRWGEQIGRAHV